MDQKERAMKKFKTEIDKDIEMAVNASKRCTMLELLYFIYLLHVTRLIEHFPNTEQFSDKLVQSYSNMLEESLKYLISLITKFGQWGFVVDERHKLPVLNEKLTQFLLKHANYINSKYESEAIISLYDVQVSGERDRCVSVDMSKAANDPETLNLLNYFIRIDEDNNIKKSSKKDIKSLLASFKEEYINFADLFEQEMGITIDEYCSIYDTLLQIVVDKLKETERFVDKLPNGNIEVMTMRSMILFSICFVLKKDEVFEMFSSKYHSALNRLIFDPTQFNEKQLRYHHVNREPLICHKEMILVSPEILLDGLFTNIHYSLIESIPIKKIYIARQASIFLDKIVITASKFGYKEVEREKDLFEGNNQIGDIDIILANEEGHHLLIEAKNHALPLDVYFKDVIKTKNHLLYLQTKWEKQVKRRFAHLTSNSGKYTFTNNFSYIVVSRFPEIISHFSDLLILSIQEFDVWLTNGRDIDTFEDFYKKYHEEARQYFSMEEIEMMQKDNLLFGSFDKPDNAK